MNDQTLIGLNCPTPKEDRRRRGDHSVACKCPEPVWFAPEKYRPLPGEYGHAMRNYVVKDKVTGQWRLRQRLSRHPYFVKLRKAAGRERDFRPERRNLIDAIAPLLVQRADMATSVVTVHGSGLARELSPKDENGNVIPETRVEPCRLSRLFQELARFGLIELPCLEWDPVEKYWMPRHIILTDRFWKLSGVNMDKLLQQRNVRLEAQAEGIIEPGTHESVRAARKRWYENMRMATLLHRREKAVKEKRRKRLSRLPLDERRQTMASWLIRSRPNHELFNLDADGFDRLVWQSLNQLELGLGYEPAPPDVVH
ncbi:plasmid replication initiator RepA [Pantoea ananatis]|uniref:plasmid replication initiator RepA n=1 Tax=Pantoea ananas TaxID=553 RepID=UPI00287EDEE6|nr:plasmid replication initiator RepA [Pantoea ananatis]MDS7721654.1 plasmid replication initiator RepA [Pantoea ananatis]